MHTLYIDISVTTYLCRSIQTIKYTFTHHDMKDSCLVDPVKVGKDYLTWSWRRKGVKSEREKFRGIVCIMAFPFIVFV